MMRDAQDRPARALNESDYRDVVPVHVVWELTLACDLKCLHCGSRAGHHRHDELNTNECLEIVDSLARLGTREITLIGGEAYLRRDWTEIVAAIRAHDIYCVVQTGGRSLTPQRLESAVRAGINGVGVSLDGLEQLHDRLRGVKGSFARAVDTLERARDSGVAISVNTQIGAQTMTDLPGLMELLLRIGVTHWQLQLTVAMGNAADHDELLLQPWRLIELMPLLAHLYSEGLDRGILINMGNNIGYFGPYEHLWRGLGDERVHWTGCLAGHTGLAIEADGTVKGCPSLATAIHTSGNVRDMELHQLWRYSGKLQRTRERSTQDLWGFCRRCYYVDVCRGGCTWNAESLFGRPGNNPYCHYRVLSLAADGLRERVAKVADAPATSFAIGEFELLVERISDGAIVSRTRAPERPAAPVAQEEAIGIPPPQLELCGACRCYIHAGEVECPLCGAEVANAAAAFRAERDRRLALIANLQSKLRLAEFAFSVEARPPPG